MSPKEAAAAIGVGRTFLYEAISSGALKTIKIGARRLIMIDALKAWLQLNEVRVASKSKPHA